MWAGWWYSSVNWNLDKRQDSMNADWLITNDLQSNLQWPRGSCPCSCLPNLPTDDLEKGMESMLIKFADGIKQRGRRPTGPRSKMISTAWNNSLNLTRWNLIGINGGSCTWVQKSNCTWGGGEVAKLQSLGWSFRDFIDSRLSGSPQCDVNVKNTRTSQLHH